MNKRRDTFTKWEWLALQDCIRWHKDSTAIRLNARLTALKDKQTGKWYLIELEQKEQVK